MTPCQPSAYNLCMKGAIRTLEGCPACRGKFEETQKGLRCPKCKTIPSRLYIDFWWQGERIRVFQNKDGEPFSSYEMTNRFLTVMRAKVDAGEFDPREYIRVEVKRLHFDNYTAAWLGRREKEVERGHLSRGYLRSVKIYLNRYLLPYFKARSIRDMHEGLIEDFRDQLPTHLKAKTVFNIMGILSKMLADAHRRRDINRLPAFPTTEVPDPETKWIGRDDQERLLAEVKDPVRRTLFLLMMETGCRPGEARALKWSRVQFKADKIIIAAAMDRNVYREHTKEGDVRLLPIGPKLKQALMELPRGTVDDFVFTFKGAPFKAEVVRRAWREVAKKVGIEANCYQGTRHSIASQAINCGIPLEVIGGMLGHKTRSSTTRYAHLNNEALNQMLNRDSELAKSGPSVNRQQEEKGICKILDFRRKKG